ncbi:MAG: D-alanyl-D-alanine carboxypeptidase family protein, partial [Novosphingobium sp.]
MGTRGTATSSDRYLTGTLSAAVALLASYPAHARPELPAAVDGVPVVMLVDLASGRVLYQRHPDRRLLPASMTKVMTAHVAFDLLSQGKLSANATLPVPDEIARQWRGRGTSLYLQAGERVPVDLLIRGITTVSANDGAMVLAVGHAGSVTAWTALMNAQARKFGMKNSHFATPHGWPDNGATYTTARDLIVLADAMTRHYPDFYARYFGHRTLTHRGLTQTNHDPVTGMVAGADGIKTGFTSEAGYNFLGSAQRQGRRLVLVIGGAASDAQRAKAARAMLEWG